MLRVRDVIKDVPNNYYPPETKEFTVRKVALEELLNSEVDVSKTWIDMKNNRPENLQIVLVVVLNNYGNRYVTLAQYVEHRKVKSEDFLNDDCEPGDLDWYEDETDCYWVNAGFFEHQYAADVNYRISDEVLFWMSTPKLPVTSPHG